MVGTTSKRKKRSIASANKKYPAQRDNEEYDDASSGESPKKRQRRASSVKKKKGGVPTPNAKLPPSDGRGAPLPHSALYNGGLSDAEDDEEFVGVEDTIPTPTRNIINNLKDPNQQIQKVSPKKGKSAMKVHSISDLGTTANKTLTFDGSFERRTVSLETEEEEQGQLEMG